MEFKIVHVDKSSIINSEPAIRLEAQGENGALIQLSVVGVSKDSRDKFTLGDTFTISGLDIEPAHQIHATREFLGGDEPVLMVPQDQVTGEPAELTNTPPELRDVEPVPAEDRGNPPRTFPPVPSPDPSPEDAAEARRKVEESDKAAAEENA